MVCSVGAEQARRSARVLTASTVVLYEMCGPWVTECNCLKAVTWRRNLDAILEIVDLDPWL